MKNCKEATLTFPERGLEGAGNLSLKGSLRIRLPRCQRLDEGLFAHTRQVCTDDLASVDDEIGIDGALVAIVVFDFVGVARDGLARVFAQIQPLLLLAITRTSCCR